MSDMQIRSCACGCKLTFRCLPGSPQRYAGRMCEASVTPGGLQALHARDMAAMTKRKRGRRPLPDGLIGTEKLSAAIGISTWTIREWTRFEKIPFERVGPRLIGFRLEAVKAVMKRDGLGASRYKQGAERAAALTARDVDGDVSIDDADDCDDTQIAEDPVELTEEDEECPEEDDPGPTTEPDPPSPSSQPGSGTGSPDSTESAPSESAAGTASPSARVTGPFLAEGPGELSPPCSSDEPITSRSGDARPSTRTGSSERMPPAADFTGSTTSWRSERKRSTGMDSAPQSESEKTESAPSAGELIPAVSKRILSGISDASRLMDSIVLPSDSGEAKSPRINYIDSSIRHLHDLMKDVATEDARKRTSPEMINAVCNLAKNTRELLKLKLEIYEAATKEAE